MSSPRKYCIGDWFADADQDAEASEYSVVTLCGCQGVTVSLYFVWLSGCYCVLVSVLYNVTDVDICVMLHG